MAAAADFPTDLSGLAKAAPPAEITLEDGESLRLRIAPVAKRIRDAELRMLAYNGSIPGPTICVREGSRIEVVIENAGDTEATVHWHGLRLENRYDGTHETQRPLRVGESFTAYLDFPDPGIYWYHPHIREDYNQELGLYGAIVVEPAEAGYWPPAHREIVLTLDDVLIEDGRIASFERGLTTHSAMGRFGNLFLVAGEADLRLSARANEVVRLYLLNTANTRVFNVTAPGARLKLVGADSGRVEREQFVDSVLLAPSERAVVDVVYEQPGEFALEHRTPQTASVLATVDVAAGPQADPVTDSFADLRTNGELVALRDELREVFEAEPDKSLVFTAELDLSAVEHEGHMEDGGHQGHMEDGGHQGHMEDTGGGIEWEDEMVEMNRLTSSSNMLWKIVDQQTAAANAEIDWRFRVGDRVKLRLFNEKAGDHPMHHPFHVHGAGRFLILSRDGDREPNLAWKDTVLVRAGETVDLLLELTHPGRWMAHCHIAEHHESGMHFSFDVDPA